ncbi:MAG: hypothetical protein GY940_27520, partial [bacterium]|nr:hypothetical protein [bacterium]
MKFKTSIFCFIPLFVIFIFCPGVLSGAIPASERTALIDLYNSTNGAGWNDSTNWNGAAGTENTWSGVTVTNILGNDHVTGISLSSNNLAGPLPASLENLTQLNYLYLGSNQLTGNIPQQLFNLTNLSALSLSSNQLTGNIPSTIGNLTSLTYLRMFSNQLTGTIPPELGTLPNLYWIWLSSNQLTGSIPPELGSLPNLQYLYLSGNQLSGNIPPQLGSLPQIDTLLLGGNQLTGSIPPELGNLSTLTYMILANNRLTGTIPPQLGNLSNIGTLLLGGNLLTGSIPAELGNLTNLTELQLQGNQLTGSIPAELGNMSSLFSLYLNNNQLTGPIPPGLENLSNLDSLVLEYNQLTGSIPTQLGNLPNLRYCSLKRNQLTGPIPTQLGNLSTLQYFSLNGNKLTGDIPGNLLNLTALAAGGSDFRYNGIFTNDAALKAFLDSKQDGGDWESTQTSAPANVTASTTGNTSISITWTPITYTANSGGYRVFYSTTSGEPYTLFGTTADKTASQMEVTGLNSGTTYYFVVQTRTGSHYYNSNVVDSDYSHPEASDTTTAIITIPTVEREALIALYNSTNGDNWTNNSGWKTPPLAEDGFAMPGTEDTWNGIYLSGTHVMMILFNTNNLTGSIPPELGNLPYLNSLLLQGNQLTGNIPPELGNLSNLVDIQFQVNQLTGSIPAQLGNLSNLTSIYLQFNQLSGSIPTQLGNLSNLTNLHISSNQLSGDIPSALSSLTSLVAGGLDLKWNALYTNNAPLKTFLDSKQSGGDWESTQTIAPGNITADSHAYNSIQISWTPISYTSDTGGYRVFYSTASSGPYTLFDTTPDKTVSQMDVTGLDPGVDYYFIVQTRTNPHTYNYYIVDSGYSDWVQASTQNQAPVADPGEGQTVHPGASVTLDGSNSYDPDENYPLTYSWSIVQKPAGSQASLTTPDQVTTSITIDTIGDYRIRLVVTDGLNLSSEPAETLISTSNSPPVADAGGDQSVTLVNTTVFLDGSQSWDPDGDDLTYLWTFIQTPAGSQAVLSDPTAVNPDFTADVYGTYEIQLVVSDPWVSSPADSVIVSFDNIAPVADAGANQSTNAGDTVVFDGSGSSDPNGDSLTYSWQIASKPLGSNAQLVNPGSVNPSLQPDVAGDYVVSLVVNDGLLDSLPDTATVVAISYQDAATQKVDEMITTINNIPNVAFKNGQHQKNMTRKVSSILLLVSNGNYTDAYDQLRNGVQKKT